MTELRGLSEMKGILAGARTIAVLGAHPKRFKAAFYVPEYLHGQGYRILPVNSRYVGQELWGEPVRASLAELGESVDIVDIFRASAKVPEHLADILAMEPLPALVWLQQGIRNDEVGRAMHEAGIDFVQDRCTLADHRALGLRPVEGGP
jgi:uncharacterized protein